jgi:hypothetical protein
VPFEAVAQRERPGELVAAHAPFVDHLRLDLQLFVEREQRVVDHHAVVGADERRGPDGIDDLEVGVERHFQRRFCRRAGWRKCQRRRRQCREAQNATASETHGHGTHFWFSALDASAALGRRGCPD